MDRGRNPSTVPVSQSDSEGSVGPRHPAVVQHMQSAPLEAGMSGAEYTRVGIPDSGNSSSAGYPDVRPQSGLTAERHHLLGGPEGFSTLPRSQDNPYVDFEPVSSPPPVRRRNPRVHETSRRAPGLSPPDTFEEKPEMRTIETRTTVGERLKPTIEHATEEKMKYAKKALWTGYALNIAIGLQVLLGALTTGLASALTGKQARGAATMVASYLARARGSNEPELSITRVKDLEQFLREAEAFRLDHAHEYATPNDGLDQRVAGFRRRFEELLGNANG
ncbi:hypothetical protein BU15DRAFT_60128 [Melanogaster broomeanus]|nr:hypothetical protein BU15DRAFT_60128 [Melanogaster broomeanus]